MKSIIFSVVFLFLIFSFSGCLDEPEVNMPTLFTMGVHILEPVNYTTISDSITIKVAISTDKQINRVSLYVDSTLKKDFYYPGNVNYFKWDVRDIPDGSRRYLQAKAYTSKGEELKSSKTTVWVYRFMPSELKAEITSDTTVRLDWKDNCKFETGFEIESAVNDSNFTKITEVDSNVVIAFIKGNFNLTDKFYFRVRAKSKSGYSGYSNIGVASSPLKPPSDFNITLKPDTAVIVSWTDNSIVEDGFRIQMSMNPNIGFSTIKTVPTNTTSTTIYHPFQKNNVYYFRIFSVKGSEESDYVTSQGFSFVMNPPSNLMMENISDNSIKLKWTSNCYFTNKHRIERSALNGIWNEIAVTGQNINEYIDSYLDTSEVYEYRVTALAKHNESNPSSELKIGFSPSITLFSKINIPEYFSNMQLYDNKRKIAAGVYSNGFSVRLYDAFSGTIIQTLPGIDSIPMQHYPGIIAISENGKYAASVWTSKVLHVWDCETGALIKTLKLSMIPPKLLFSNDCKYLLIPINNRVNFLSLTTLTYVYQHYSSGIVNDLAISKSGEYFVCTGSNYRLEVRSTTSGNLLNTLTGSESVQNVFYSADDNLIYGSKSNMIYTWSASNGSLIKTIPCSTTYGEFDISPSAKYFLIPRGGALDLISNEKMIKIGSTVSSYCENVKFYSDDNYFFADQRVNIGIWQIGASKWRKID